MTHCRVQLLYNPGQIDKGRPTKVFGMCSKNCAGRYTGQLLVDDICAVLYKAIYGRDSLGGVNNNVLFSKCRKKMPTTNKTLFCFPQYRIFVCALEENRREQEGESKSNFSMEKGNWNRVLTLLSEKQRGTLLDDEGRSRKTKTTRATNFSFWSEREEKEVEGGGYRRRRTGRGPRSPLRVELRSLCPGLGTIYPSMYIRYL